MKDFKTSVKGNIAQTLVQTLLEHSGYRAVGMGIEQIVREVKHLTPEQYGKLGVSKALRRLPDFLVTTQGMSATWLVEVKYRKRWNAKTRTQLAEVLEDQVAQWQPIFLILLLGESAHQNDTSFSFLGVARLEMRENTLGVISPKIFKGEKFTPWNEVTWSHFQRFHDVFHGVSNSVCKDEAESSILNTICMLKSLSDLDEVA